MKLFEIRIGNRYCEIIQGDARGMRAGRVPEAVRAYALNKLEYVNRFTELVSHVEISRVELYDVTTREPAMRVLLEILPVKDRGDATVGNS